MRALPTQRFALSPRTATNLKGDSPTFGRDGTTLAARGPQGNRQAHGRQELVGDILLALADGAS